MLLEICIGGQRTWENWRSPAVNPFERLLHQLAYRDEGGGTGARGCTDQHEMGRPTFPRQTRGGSRWLVEEDPVEVSAEFWKHDPEKFRVVEEGISFRMRFPSGLVAQGSSTYGAVLSSFIYVQGTRGWVSLTQAFPFDVERRLSGRDWRATHRSNIQSHG